MADNEYIEVPAVVRIPKGERLADSKRTPGWSRGFTPKSSDKGPEHVEIRLTGAAEALADAPDEPDAPAFVYDYEYIEPEESREEQEADELLGTLVILGLIKAAEWAEPHLRRLLAERVLPFLAAKREQWRGRRRNKARRATRAEKRTKKRPTDGMKAAGAALSVYEADMTSTEARRHLAELLVAERFLSEKRRLLAHARISDDVPSEVTDAVKALTPNQVAKALESILSSRPTVLDDLRRAVSSERKRRPRQLGSRDLHEVLRLTQAD